MYNVFHKFRIIGFDAFPFLGGANALIGNGFAAKLILTDVRLHIGELATGSKLKSEFEGF